MAREAPPAGEGERPTPRDHLRLNAHAFATPAPYAGSALVHWRYAAPECAWRRRRLASVLSNSVWLLGRSHLAKTGRPAAASDRRRYEVQCAATPRFPAAARLSCGWSIHSPVYWGSRWEFRQVASVRIAPSR